MKRGGGRSRTTTRVRGVGEAAHWRRRRASRVDDAGRGRRRCVFFRSWGAPAEARPTKEAGGNGAGARRRRRRRRLRSAAYRRRRTSRRRPRRCARAGRALLAEGAELLERDAGDPGLFHQLARGGAVERLVRVDESARERPGALVRRALAFDEEDGEVAGAHREQDAVGGDGGAGELVGERHEGEARCRGERCQSRQGERESAPREDRGAARSVDPWALCPPVLGVLDARVVVAIADGPGSVARGPGARDRTS